MSKKKMNLCQHQWQKNNSFLSINRTEFDHVIHYYLQFCYYNETEAFLQKDINQKETQVSPHLITDKIRL